MEKYFLIRKPEGAGWVLLVVSSINLAERIDAPIVIAKFYNENLAEEYVKFLNSN